MRARKVKTYEEIVKYIEEEIFDETSEAIHGIDTFKKYLADDDQEAMIEEWVKEIWENIKEDIIFEEEQYRNYTFEQVPLLGKFVYNTFAMAKIMDEDTGVEMGIDYMGRRTLIEPNEVVERA
jgi:hypothetical protein